MKKLLPMLLFLACTGQAMAQCNVINTNSFTTFAPMTINVTKTLSAAASCMTTAMNAFGCFPGAASFSTNMLYATKVGTADPYCNWSCTCGTGAPPHVTINTSDGLPVELLEFEVSD